MAYLGSSGNVGLPTLSKLFDVDGTGEDGDFFSTKVKFGSMGSGVKPRGKIDVAMAAEHHQGIHTTARNMWAGIELKKQDDSCKLEIHPQLILQHLSALNWDPNNHGGGSWSEMTLLLVQQGAKCANGT